MSEKAFSKIMRGLEEAKAYMQESARAKCTPRVQPSIDETEHLTATTSQSS